MTATSLGINPFENPKLYTQSDLAQARLEGVREGEESMHEAISQMMQEEFANWGGSEHAAYQSCCKAVWKFNLAIWNYDREWKK
jgi:hypothetical protein